MEKDNNMLMDILVFLLKISYLYMYVITEKDNNMLLDILVFLLIIPYCAGMY
jgi:hypothetical protein